MVFLAWHIIATFRTTHTRTLAHAHMLNRDLPVLPTSRSLRGTPTHTHTLLTNLGTAQPGAPMLLAACPGAVANRRIVQLMVCGFFLSVFQ
jgi:hypothetical protein